MMNREEMLGRIKRTLGLLLAQEKLKDTSEPSQVNFNFPYGITDHAEHGADAEDLKNCLEQSGFQISLEPYSDGSSLSVHFDQQALTQVNTILDDFEDIFNSPHSYLLK